MKFPRVNSGKIRAALLAGAVLFMSCAASAEQPYRDEIIVKYKDSPDASELGKYRMLDGSAPDTKEKIRSDIEKRHGLSRDEKYLPEKHFSVYRVKEISRLKETAEEISKSPGVEYAEPNYIRKAFYSVLNPPNDPHYLSGSSQWGYNKVQADRVYNSGMISSGLNRTVVVGVLDSGLYFSHEDMQGTYVTGKNFVSSGLPNDDGTVIGHGTHVSSIIAANTNNGTGISGTGFISGTAKVLIMPVKVVDSDGYADDAGIYSGLVWAADNGAKVINMSLGGPQAGITLLNGVNYADSKGCIIVAAAGNDNTETFFPAAYTKVIAVAATDSVDNKASFSNYGKIDLAAPGVDIDSCGNQFSSYYDLVDGTSFSAPFVSAAAALVLLKNPAYTPAQVRSVLEQSADDIGDAGYDEKFGWGRLNVYRALSGDFKKPSKGIKTYNWPNPFNPSKDVYTTITVFLETPENITIEIYDAGGIIVWKKEAAASDFVSGQAYNCNWDGKNMEGKAAGNGVYFYTVKDGSEIGKSKIAVVR